MDEEAIEKKVGVKKRAIVPEWEGEEMRWLKILICKLWGHQDTIEYRYCHRCGRDRFFPERYTGKSIVERRDE